MNDEKRETDYIEQGEKAVVLRREGASFEDIRDRLGYVSAQVAEVMCRSAEQTQIIERKQCLARISEQQSDAAVIEATAKRPSERLTRSIRGETTLTPVERIQAVGCLRAGGGTLTTIRDVLGLPSCETAQDAVWQFIYPEAERGVWRERVEENAIPGLMNGTCE